MKEGATEKDGVTTAYGLWRYGNDYYNAAVTLDKFHSESLFMPFYATVGQSIELSLKSFLLASGVKLNKLRYGLGHDLYELLVTAENKNLDQVVKIENIHFGAIDIMSKEYLDKKYHYIKTGEVILPESVLILDAAKVLSMGLKDFCYRNTTWEYV